MLFMKRLLLLLLSADHVMSNMICKVCGQKEEVADALCTHPKTNTVNSTHSFTSTTPVKPTLDERKPDADDAEMDDGSGLLVDKTTREKYIFGCNPCATRLNINKRLYCKETGAGKCRHIDCEPAGKGVKRESAEGSSQASGPVYKRTRDDPKKLPTIVKRGALRIARGVLANEQDELEQLKEEVTKKQKEIERQQKEVDKAQQLLDYLENGEDEDGGSGKE